MTTTSERVDALMTLSDQIYPILETEVDGQIRSRRLLRLGIAASATALQHGTVRYAGDQVHRLVLGELHSAGLVIDDPAYDRFARYRDAIHDLPRITRTPKVDPALDRLAQAYADVRRATVTLSGSRETNATHVGHLLALALPYAAEYHPDLDQAKIALYCLLHDILEAYVGDVPSFGISDETMTAKIHAEHQALEQLKTDFADSHPRLVQLVIDYEQLIDDEARFVKTFDKMDPAFTHFYSQGIQLIGMHAISSANQFLDTTTITTERMQPYCLDFPDLMRDRRELHERVAAHVPWPVEC